MTRTGTTAEDYEWQLSLRSAQREILCKTFAVGPADVAFTSADSEDDRRRNTDVWVMLEGRPRRVSMRMRRYVFGDEFTMRYLRPDSPTEWQKLWAGFGDFYFYGKGTARSTIEDWFVGRLDVFRDWVMGFLRRGELPPHVLKSNKDGSSQFVAFSRADLPLAFTVAEDRTSELRECCWTIIRNTRDLTSTGHSATVRWARGVLEFDSETSA